MPTSTNVTNLKINKLTEAQYDAAVQGGVIGANELSVITDLDESIQVSTMPAASADELGKVYQFIGTTSASYTHGYFYECVSDGQNPATYSWVQTNVQPSGGGSSLPTQTGHEGQFLFTNGSNASWRDNIYTNSVTKEYTFDENTNRFVLRLTPKANRDCYVNISVFEGYDDGEGNIVKGSKLYGVKSYLAYADLLEPYPTKSIMSVYNQELCNLVDLYITCVPLDMSGDYFEVVTEWIGDMPDGIPSGEERYAFVELEYSDGIDTLTDELAEGGGTILFQNGTLPSTVRLNALAGEAIDQVPVFLGNYTEWRPYPFTNVRGGDWNNNKTVVCENGSFVTKYYSQITEIPQLEGELGSQYEYDHALFQYTGDTDSTYTHGYFYEVYYVLDRNASASQTTGSSLSDIAVDAETCAEWLKDAGISWDSGDYTYTFNGSNWEGMYGEAYSTADLGTIVGVTFTGTPVNGDVITITYDTAQWGWKRVDVQPTPSELPSQSGQSGKFLTTDGTSVSWSDKPLVNNTTTTGSLAIGTTLTTTQHKAILIGDTLTATPYGITGDGAVIIGNNIKGDNYFHGVCISPNPSGVLLTESGAVAIGCEANNTNGNSQAIAIGNRARTSAINAIQLGSTTGTTYTTNSDANTFKVANVNGNFEIMSADGTMPTDRFTTTPVANGTYVPTVTISSGVATRSWTTPASAPVVPSTMPTLAAANWSSNAQTVNVTGVTASNIVFVSPAPASATEYGQCGVVCTAQGAGTLTFTCTNTPASDLTVNVLIM